MQKKAFLLAFVAIAVMLTAAWAASLLWGGLAPIERRSEIFLTKFDMITAVGEENCFSLQVNSTHWKERLVPYVVIANRTVVVDSEIDLSKSPLLHECIPASSFSLGENLVKIQVDKDDVFYHATLVEEAKRKAPLLSVSFEGNERVHVNVENNDGTKYAPLEIFVNGKLDHRLYFSGDSFESSERVSLEDGENEIRAEFRGIAAATTAEKSSGFGMHPAVGIALMSALLCVLAFLVFARQPLLEKIAYSILSFFSILIVAFFLLEVLGILSAFNFTLLVLLLTAGLAIIFRGNLDVANAIGKIDWMAGIRKFSPMLLLLVGILIFSSFFFNFFTTSYYSIWTSFYERQSSTIAELEAVPFTDQFSFLGTKPFGYISGYFFINPGVSWITGLGTQQSYAVIMLLAQVAFLASALLFFRSFGFDKKRSYLTVIALLLGGFVFSDFSFNIRHVISYAMLLLSLYFLRKGKWIASGIALAFGAFVQTPIILMFLFSLPIVLTEKKTIKTAVKGLVAGAAIALLLFAPTLLRYGIPTQAEYNVWGYMWSIPLYGFFLDYLAVVALIGLFIVPFLLLGKVHFDRFSLRVGAFLALFIFIQLFISYRINVVATIAFALFIGLLFPKRFWEHRTTEYSLSVLFAVAFALMFLLIISFYPVPVAGQNTFRFVRENTSTEANFLNEPYLGHPFIHATERKCTADLAVEYANSEMIRDSFEFIKTGNSSILEKYGIDYVVNRSVFLDEKPVGDNFWHKTLEYEQLDKIYSNSLFFVHWNSGRGRN